jgi:hypothetical protein
MTERKIKKDELRTSLANLGIHFDGINEIIEAAFPPIFKPKKGEVIWSSIANVDSRYRLRVFSHIEDNEYACFDNGGENTSSPYPYAKPQTPRNKGE